MTTKNQAGQVSVNLDELMTVKQLCEALHFHPVTLANQRREGRGIPFIKLGRKVFYRRADVEAILAKNFRGTPLAA